MTSLTLFKPALKMSVKMGTIKLLLRMFHFSLFVFSSGWDFHMVSNLTLLDQRLWGSGVRFCVPFRLGSKLYPEIGLFICLHIKTPSFFNINLWYVLCFIRITFTIPLTSLLLSLMILSVIMSISIRTWCFISIFTFYFLPSAFNFNFTFELRHNFLLMMS